MIVALTLSPALRRDRRRQLWTNIGRSSVLEGVITRISMSTGIGVDRYQTGCGGAHDPTLRCSTQ
jgi:hypothetical protein